MKFIKRLIIMSGENKGTLAIEKNASYVNAKFNSFGKSVLNGNLVMLIDGKKHYRKLNGDKESFSLETESLESVHAAVFFGDKLVMYGTNDAKRLDLTQIDALRPQKKAYALTLADNGEESKTDVALDKIFSSRNGRIEGGDKSGYIESGATTQDAQLKAEEAQEYVDDAISETNYYPPEYSQIESDAESADVIKENVFAQESALKQENKLQQEGECVMSELPSSKCSKYLYSMREGYASKTQEPENEPIYKKEPEKEPEKEPVCKKEPVYEHVYQPAYGAYEAAAAIQPKFNAEKVPPVQKEIHIAAREGNFYERCGDDIEKIFAQSEREKDLEEVLPNSKWVRIDYNDSGKYYVMGLIGKEYLCYGVPADFTPVPPEELKGYCWWLPLKPDKPKAKGYWIMYQSLKTGEAVLPST